MKAIEKAKSVYVEGFSFLMEIARPRLTDKDKAQNYTQGSLLLFPQIKFQAFGNGLAEKSNLLVKKGNINFRFHAGGLIRCLPLPE